MSSIKLLDCTLRDGGYINDWKFGKREIIDTFSRLDSSGVDYIEIGFLDDRREFDEDRTIQPSTKCYDRIYSGIKKENAFVVAMIDYGTCSIENIGPCEESFIDGIRIIFKKPNMQKAVAFAKQVKEKGYAVFLQLVSITAYSDRDLLDLIDLANGISPYAVSIVDTYGLMHKEKMLHYFHLLDTNLSPEINIGFHSHNNFQLAYSNAIELVRLRTTHNLLLDGSIFGMGKNAGNTPIELLCMYLNDNMGAKYDVSQILEIIDLTVLKIYKETPWGYSMPLFIAASNDCHPSYVSTLMKKNTLSISSVNQILKGLTGDNKLNYNPELIEKLYMDYQKTTLCDKNKEQLMSMLKGKDILLIGPGISVVSHKNEISDFIKNNNVITISVNCLPDFDIDCFFVGNAKRYSMLSAFLAQCEGVKKIATSNVSSINDEFDFVMNFDKLADENSLLFDNGMIMALKILIEAGAAKVYLAGFDGFRKENVNFYSDFMELNADPDRITRVSAAIKERIEEYKSCLNIEFITPSYYSENE